MVVEGDEEFGSGLEEVEVTELCSVLVRFAFVQKYSRAVFSPTNCPHCTALRFWSSTFTVSIGLFIPGPWRWPYYLCNSNRTRLDSAPSKPNPPIESGLASSRSLRSTALVPARQ